MVYCCVPKCLSRSDRKGNIAVDGSKITFHAFPLKPENRIAWILAVKRQGEKPNVLWTPKNSSSVVCSRHFLPTDFKQGLKYKCLVPSAVPSVFNADHRTFLKKRYPTEDFSSGKQLKKIAIPSQNLPVLPAEEVSKETEVNQISRPLDPQLVQVWSCSEIENDCKPVVAINDEINYLPSFMKQAFIEKEKIDRTYEETSAANISILMRNGNLQSDQSEPEKEIHKNNPNISDCVKIEVDSLQEDNVQNSSSSYNSVPYFESLPPVTQTVMDSSHISTSDLHILSNLLSNTKKVKMRDASTSTEYPDLRKKLEECRIAIAGYRKKVKNLQQINRRYRNQIMNMKHAVFCELQNRHYLSKKPDFNSEEQGCLLDRHSIKVCQSSETEESEED